MGIGRREFLRIFGSTLAGVCVAPSLAVVIRDDDLYINRKLGLAFRKPAGWHFASVQQMGECLRGEMLDLEDRALIEKIKADTELPLVAISQEPVEASSNRFTPGITMYLDRYSAESSDGKPRATPAEVICRDIEGLASVLRRFQITAAPKRIMLSECEAHEYTSTYLFEHVGLSAPEPIRMRSILIVQEPAWYTLRLYDSFQTPKEVDYSAFLNGIRVL